jgi:predicted type IV restriction endonuclease
MRIPKRVEDRFSKTLKKYQIVAESHKARDVSEADTVTLIKDMLAEVFGYDKYQELTSEQAIRGTFCDLAVKLDGKIKLLIEIKSAGVKLNDNHLRQALNYGVNEGIEWIVLTNSVEWKVYKVIFGQPVDFEEITSFDILNVSAKSEEDKQKLFLLCREGMSSDAIETFHEHIQIFNKFTISQIIRSESVLSQIKKDLRRLFPEVKIDVDDLKIIIEEEVLKRELIDGEKVIEAEKQIKKASNKLIKKEVSSPSIQVKTDPSI